MKKKKKIIILVVLILFLIIYFGAKIVLLNTLPNIPDYFMDVKEAFNNPKTITIHKNTENITDYFTYEDMKIRNDFEKSDQEYESLYNIKNSDIKITISKEPKNYLLSYVKENSKIPNLNYDLTKDLEKNNVRNDYELYTYLFQNVDKKVNIFSSIHAIKRAHTILGASFIILQDIKKVTLIDGDYEGYIIEKNADKTAYIYHNEESYYLHIWSKDFTDEKLYDLISTINFEEWWYEN